MFLHVTDPAQAVPSLLHTEGDRDAFAFPAGPLIDQNDGVAQLPDDRQDTGKVVHRLSPVAMHQDRDRGTGSVLKHSGRKLLPVEGADIHPLVLPFLYLFDIREEQLMIVLILMSAQTVADLFMFVRMIEINEEIKPCRKRQRKQQQDRTDPE